MVGKLEAEAYELYSLRSPYDLLAVAKRPVGEASKL
ncbi:uncharacterized protein G2W53_026044 [Senna tora]|uniref:Uncharacterized protein n=1 Tax=Senna tora TaxID=362788 RepID=A0A834TN86_9FABA|nr:uncharacterized protein G2W53_026044 [Senna tora]